jgi:hypothetical protein
MVAEDKTRVAVTIDKDLKHRITLAAAEDRREFSAEMCALAEAGLKLREKAK